MLLTLYVKYCLDVIVAVGADDVDEALAMVDLGFIDSFFILKIRSRCMWMQIPAIAMFHLLLMRRGCQGRADCKVTTA